MLLCNFNPLSVLRATPQPSLQCTSVLKKRLLNINELRLKKKKKTPTHCSVSIVYSVKKTEESKDKSEQYRDAATALRLDGELNSNYSFLKAEL